jgi:hypothetical protein
MEKIIMADQSFNKYLTGLPVERKSEIEKVWTRVRESVPGGYTEEIGEKFLSFKAGDDWYVALANQKNYISLYLMPIYVFPELQAKLDASGKKLKCGKSCINFKRADDLPLDVIAGILSANEAEAYKARVRQVRDESRTKRKDK